MLGFNAISQRPISAIGRIAAITPTVIFIALFASAAGMITVRDAATNGLTLSDSHTSSLTVTDQEA